MKKIRLLMIPINQDRIEFHLVDRILKTNVVNNCDFYLKRFDIIEIQNNLYSIDGYGLTKKDLFFSLELEISKSENLVNLFIINDETKDGIMKLKELKISTGSTRGGGYTIIDNCIILSKKISKVEISNIEIENLEIINRDGLSDLRISHITIENLTIESGGKINIENSKIKEFKILGIKEEYKANINVLETTIEELLCDNSYIDSFVYYKTGIEGGKVSDTEINSIIIEKSSFGAVRFFNVVLLGTVAITKSFIEKIQMFNVSWCNNLLDNHNIDPLDLRDTYRQLKYIYENSHNQIEANKFFAKEMEYHLKALKNDNTRKWDYRVAYLQKEISDFGNDWILAFQWYLIVSGIGFFLALSGTIFWYNFTGEIGENNFYEMFLMYINPLPKIDEVPGFWYLLVSITKILIVYQIVVALRRISQR